MKKPLIILAFFIFLFVCTKNVSAAAISWSETQPAGNTSQQWNGMATSEDGQTVLAGVDVGRLYLSTNGGTSWTETQPAGNINGEWLGLTITPDGQKMIAANFGGRLYISTNRGASWAETQPAGNADKDWLSVGISDDGQKILAADWFGRLYTSANGGSTWTETQPAGNGNKPWYTVAVSGDGQTFVAGINPGRLYISTNSGSSWTETQPVGNATRGWYFLAISRDGATVFAGTDFGTNLYKTTNRGTTWTALQPAGNTSIGITSISLSSSGQNVFITTETKKSYLSYDGGTNWVEDSFVSTADFGFFIGAMSKDGWHFYEGEWVGRVYRGTIPPPPPSNPSSTQASSAKPTGCGDSTPEGTVDLFQINRTGATAQLFFTPVKGVRKYHVMYGLKEGDERFSALGQETDSDSGVQKIAIQNLGPQTAYWFKIVPVNGCATGSWSNWLKAGNSKTSYFKY